MKLLHFYFFSLLVLVSACGADHSPPTPKPWSQRVHTYMQSAPYTDAADGIALADNLLKEYLTDDLYEREDLCDAYDTLILRKYLVEKMQGDVEDFYYHLLAGKIFDIQQGITDMKTRVWTVRDINHLDAVAALYRDGVLATYSKYHNCHVLSKNIGRMESHLEQLPDVFQWSLESKINEAQKIVADQEKIARQRTVVVHQKEQLLQLLNDVNEVYSCVSLPGKFQNIFDWDIAIEHIDDMLKGMWDYRMDSESILFGDRIEVKSRVEVIVAEGVFCTGRVRIFYEITSYSPYDCANIPTIVDDIEINLIRDQKLK